MEVRTPRNGRGSKDAPELEMPSRGLPEALAWVIRRLGRHVGGQDRPRSGFEPSLMICWFAVEDWSTSIATGLEPSDDDTLKTRTECLHLHDTPISPSSSSSASASASASASNYQQSQAVVYHGLTRRHGCSSRNFTRPRTKHIPSCSSRRSSLACYAHRTLDQPSSSLSRISIVSV